MRQITRLLTTLALLPLLQACNGATTEQTTPPDAHALGLEVATFAGGCFWCVEASFEELPGVEQAISGYTGGSFEEPSYEEVAAGITGHLEAVQIYYDPKRISYRQLVEKLWRITDPTDNGGQFHDRGPEYRPAIFHHDETQRQIAEAAIEALDQSRRFDKPISVDLLPYTLFWQAC
ncbi:MAG: peptide-methionine (S)-S-oxide reductase MsrA [Candidatus Sedimenticola endophacoides]